MLNYQRVFTFYIDTTLILVIFISPVCDGFSQHPKSRHFGIQATARRYGHALVNTPDCGKWQWPTKSTDAEKFRFPLAPFWSWLSCVITRGYNPFPSISIFQVERTGCLVRLPLFLRCGTQRLDQGPGTNTTPTFPVLVDFFPAYPWSPQPKGKCGRW